MKKLFLLLAVLFFAAASAVAQRHVERMDRGVVAMHKSTSQIYVSWRFLATDPDEIAFNVYRQIGSATPVKLNGAPVTNSTNIIANIPNVNEASRIFVKPVLNGVEGAEEGSWNLTGNTMSHRIVRDFAFEPMPAGTPVMTMKFCWPADLDGDGKYDFVLDRQNYGAIEVGEEDGGSATADTYTSPKVEAYSSEGKFLWRVDIGQNVKICTGHSDMVTAYDMNGDGKAEVLMAVSEGTTFADGEQIKNADGTVHNYNSQAGSAPQWIGIVDGMTGNLIDRVELPLYSSIQTGRTDNWKDITGHFIIAYLDGINPSLVYQYKNRQVNGSFTGAHSAFRYVNGKLETQWAHRFTSDMGQFHQVRAADVDGDGRDEFIEGDYALKYDGTMLYKAPNVWHGDRHCLADIDPDRPGLEHFFIQQGNIMGMGIYDATNGEIIKGVYLSAVGDVGRGICAAFDPQRRGMQFWSTMNSNALYDSKGNAIGTTGTFPCEALWWGPELNRWEVSGIGGDGGNLAFHKINSTRTAFDRDLPNLYNEHIPYYLKAAYGGRAAFWGDILGDWREEILLARADGSGFAILSTWEVTSVRNYCLMQNPAYRMQTTARGYYQTADVDYYMAADMPRPPVAPVQRADEYIVSANSLTANIANGKSVMFDIRNSNSEISIAETLTPDTLLLINPKGKDYTFNFTGNGKLSGNLIVIKSLQGNVVLNGNHDYTGKTRISEGRMFINGNIQSPVKVDARGVVGGNGRLASGIALETGLNIEGGRIEAGNGATLGTLTIAGDLAFAGRNSLHFDIDQTKPAKNDTLKIEGNFTATGVNHSIIINQLSPVKADTLTLALFASTNATPDNFSVKGLEGVPYTLLFEADRIRLVLTEPRQAGAVTWTGAVNSLWNFQTKNFTNGSTDEFFVPGDSVYFNDNAVNKTITIAETMPVAGLKFDNESDYSIGSTGAISGSGGITKTGAGKLTISGQEHSFTGKIDFADGTLAVSSLKDGGLPSSIGASAAAASNWTMRNATLQTTAPLSTNRNMIVHGKLTIDNPATSNSLFYSGNISGVNVALEITGAGTLTMSGSNTLSTVTLRSGTLASGSVSGNNTAFGAAKITLESGTLQMYNSNDMGNTGPWKNEIIVPEGKSARWNLPNRWIFTNKVSGAGTLTINAPYVRSDLNIDWTGFSGRVNFTGSDIRLNNTSARNMINVHVDMGSDAGLYCAANGSGNSSAQNVTFGALSGSGGLNGNNSYTIGAKNISTTYSGVIGSGSGKLTKNGTGALTFTGSNLYRSGTTINAGILVAANTAGSATGTAAVSVVKGMLTGAGAVEGAVTVSSGGTISAGSYPAIDFATLKLASNLTVNGGTIELNAANTAGYPSAKIAVAGNAVLTDAILNIKNTNTTPFPLGAKLQLLTVTGTISGNVAQFNLPETAADTEWDTSKFLEDGTVSVVKATSVKNQKADSSLQVFVNENNEIIVSGKDQTVVGSELRLYNALGQLLLVQPVAGAETVIKQTLSTGIYFLKTENQAEKIIIR